MSRDSFSNSKSLSNSKSVHSYILFWDFLTIYTIRALAASPYTLRWWWYIKLCIPPPGLLIKAFFLIISLSLSLLTTTHTLSLLQQSNGYNEEFLLLTIYIHLTKKRFDILERRERREREKGSVVHWKRKKLNVHI